MLCVCNSLIVLLWNLINNTVIYIIDNTVTATSSESDSIWITCHIDDCGTRIETMFPCGCADVAKTIGPDAVQSYVGRGYEHRHNMRRSHDPLEHRDRARQWGENGVVCMCVLCIVWFYRVDLVVYIVLVQWTGDLGRRMYVLHFDCIFKWPLRLRRWSDMSGMKMVWCQLCKHPKCMLFASYCDAKNYPPRIVSNTYFMGPPRRGF